MCSSRCATSSRSPSTPPRRRRHRDMPKDYQQDFGSIITSRTSFIDEIINLARKNSIFYLLFGLACCGIELMQTGGPRADIDRFGSVPRAPPRQSDLLIVAGAPPHQKGRRRPPAPQQKGGPQEGVSMGAPPSPRGRLPH